MAIWVNYYGENKLGVSHDSIAERWNKKLQDLDVDLTFLDGTLPDSENLIPDFFTYNQNKWILEKGEFQNRPYFRIYYPLYHDNNGYIDGLKLIFYNDVIVFLGPFEHFSGPKTISSNKGLRDGYYRIMSSVFKMFEVKKVYFCDEWTFSDEENEYTFQQIDEYFGKIDPGDYWRMIDLESKSSADE